MGCTSFPHGKTVYFDVVTHHPTTGAAQDADSAPAWKIWGQIGDTPILTGSMTKRTDWTGHYKASFGIESVNGFNVGEFYQVVVSATVASVTTKQVVMTFRVLAAETTAGNVPVDRAAIADVILARDMSQVEAGAPEHSLCTIVLAALESAVSSTEWVIKRTDGTTTHVTKTVTTDVDADPITGVS